jgi:hypothetical protein
MYMRHIALHPAQLRDLRLAADPFGIYAARRALNRAGLRCTIYRGDEWWLLAASAGTLFHQASIERQYGPAIVQAVRQTIGWQD